MLLPCPGLTFAPDLQIWLDLSQLPSPLNSGLVFFEELLKEKVIVSFAYYLLPLV